MSNRIRTRTHSGTHDDTIPPDLDVISYLCSFDDAVCAYVHMIAYLHGIVVEVASVCLVWRSAGAAQLCRWAIRADAYLMIQPSPTKQYLPSDMTTTCHGPVRLSSPRIIAPLDMIVLPPRIMFCGPAMVVILCYQCPVTVP